MIRRRYEVMIFVSIIALAVFFRFYNLEHTPPGLWPDEAANGVDALKALDSGDFRIFYPANNGREGLFINIQALSINIFGNYPWALRLVSGIMGTLTVAGLYLLTRKIFTWQIASIASFLMAISFWHVNFSRIGFRAIMLPLILVWASYFLWRGLKSGKLTEFLVAGIIGGIGFYTYFSFRITPLIILVLFWNYWAYIHKDFSFAKYEETRNKLLQGFALMMLATIIIALPMGIYFLNHPEDFLKREGAPISVFAQQEPLKELSLSIVKTLGMFNFSGDYNFRHNIPGWPMLSWPVSIMFAVGFIREFIHWIKRKHGHLSPIHTFLFSWFFIMLIPGFLSTEAPHALRTIGVIPIVMIFAAQGFWWLISLISRYHKSTNYNFHTDKKTYQRQSKLLLGVTVSVFLISLISLEFNHYFRIWGQDAMVAEAFSQKYAAISSYLNQTSDSETKIVLVNEGDVLVDGVPNNAQTIKFLTRTHDQQSSINRNIYYLNQNQLQYLKPSDRLIIIPLKDSPELSEDLFWKFRLHPESYNSIIIYKTI